MAREITKAEREYAQALLSRARAAMSAIEQYDQASIDRLCQAVGWATAN
jgi:sulfoacetaldehyde dehydrogenase